MEARTDTPLDRLPHRDPFRFVSRIERIEAGTAASGVWTVTGREPFLAGHFPGDPVVPGVLIAEALAQVAGLAGFAGSSSRGRVRLARIDIKFGAPVVPPAEVRLDARTSRSLGELHLFTVRAESSGQVVADGMVTLTARSSESVP